MKIKSDSLQMDGEFVHHETKPINQSVMTLDATVEVAPQRLRKLRAFHTMVSNIPRNLLPEGQIALQCFFACFDRQKNVSEGIVKDVIWGFEQAGIPPDCTRKGLKELAKNGFIVFRGLDNSQVAADADRVDECWVEYQPKLLELCHEDSPSV